jgi:predicted ATP-grasp superfamily ATP-dependent carboligase
MANDFKIPAVILDCDYRSQEGIFQPLGRRGIPIIAISNKNDCPAFHSKYTKYKFVSPNIDDGVDQYIDFLKELPYKGVLYYSNDVNAVALSRNKDKLIDFGYLLNISNLHSLEKVFDKWQCYNYATSIGIPMAKSAIIRGIDDIYRVWESFQKPVILKGTRLAGGMYYRFHSIKEIITCWENISNTVNSDLYSSRHSDIILQEWLYYDITDNWSCETVFDKTSNPIGFYTIKRIRSSINKDGTYSSRLFAGHHEKCNTLNELTHRILSSVQWNGFAHVEYFYVPNKKKFYLTEVNPRLPGYSYYPCTAGFDMAYYYYADLTFNDLKVKKNFPKSVYFETFHYPGDLTSGLYHSLKGNIDFIKFLKSYLILLKPGIIRIIDPLRFDDPIFTIKNQLSLYKRVIYELIKSMLKKLSMLI